MKVSSVLYTFLIVSFFLTENVHGAKGNIIYGAITETGQDGISSDGQDSISTEPGKSAKDELLQDTTTKTGQSAINDTLAASPKMEKVMPLEPCHRNVIKFNPTPMLLFGNMRNVTISYERLITKNQSLSIQAGYLLFPRIVDDTVIQLITLTRKEKYGVNLAFDYRFYPFTRNRRPAPDGVYIGGFISYYGFQFKNNLDILHSDVDRNGQIQGKLNIVNLGFSLGYQFIFWKRLSLDLLLFGPSLSLYSGNLKITGNLNKDEIENIDKELVAKLMERFPILGQLFSGETLQFTGSRSNFSIGFRYSFQLGFHF